MTDDPDPTARPSMLPVAGLNAPVRRGDGAGSADGWRYTDALGLRIADLYADGEPGGLSGIHAAFPDLIPPPRVVTAWRDQFPQFGLRMKLAERVRAELLAEQSVVLADTDDRDPRRVALSIQARWRLAERLDPARFGSATAAASLGGPMDVQPTAPALSDAQLARIASGGGEAGVGVDPAAEEAGGLAGAERSETNTP